VQRGPASGPCVRVEQRLLDDECALVVAEGAREIEALRIEVGLGDGALAKRRAEHGDGIRRPDVAGLESYVRQDALERREHLRVLRAGGAGGDAVAVRRAVRLAQGIAQCELGAYRRWRQQ